MVILCCLGFLNKTYRVRVWSGCLRAIFVGLLGIEVGFGKVFCLYLSVWAGLINQLLSTGDHGFSGSLCKGCW